MGPRTKGGRSGLSAVHYLVKEIAEMQKNGLGSEAGMCFRMSKSHFREAGMSFRISKGISGVNPLRSRNVVENR